MKSIYAFLGGLLISGAISGVDTAALKAQAYTIVHQVLTEFTPRSPDSLELNLTAAERRAIERYLEKPELREVYPGIGKILTERERIGS